MQILENAPQGSPAWHAARAKHFCASEAAAANGMSKYTTRDELMRQKATGLTEEVSPAKQRIFDAGHEAEALARPIAEGIADTEFYPVVATLEIDGLPLLASFDGIDLMDELVWENKLPNASLIQQVRNADLEPHYWLQLEHQLLVSGATRALFTASDGTPEGTHALWYESKPERRAQLIAGWKQFAEDLANYEYEPEAVAPVGRAPDDLPALRIDVKAMVSAPDLEAYKNQALAVFKGINRDLQSDEDFANAEKTVKWCKGIEDKLNATKESALSQTADLDMVLRTLDALSAEARTTRLELDKLVKARKEAVRIEILNAAKQSLFDHMEALNARLGEKIRLPAITADFAGAMKGLKTIASLKNACDTELARVKIESSQVADAMELNLKSLREHAAGFENLFADAQQLVMKANEDLVLLINARISEHEAKEAARIEAEVQRKLAEEREAEAAAAPAMVLQQAKPASSRPSDAQLRKTIADQFGVTEDKADAWLREYGFVSAA